MINRQFIIFVVLFLTVYDVQGQSDVIFINSFEVIEDKACTHTINPEDSFDVAFSQLVAGETLCLNDGIYYQAMDVPSDITVKAMNDGKAELDGMGILGTQWQGGLLTMQNNNSVVSGLLVHNAHQYSDACTISGTNNKLLRTGCFDGGTHEHKIPIKVSGSDNLVEDSYGYGEGRYVVQCFVGDRNTFRRVIARWDSTKPNESSEPNAAFANYGCEDSLFENIVSLDYNQPETTMRYGGDFYMPTTLDKGNSGTRWFAIAAVNHWDGASTANLLNNNRCMRGDSKTQGSPVFTGIQVRDLYCQGSEYALVFTQPEYSAIEINDCTFVDVINMGNENCTGSPADIEHRYIDGVKTTQTVFPFPIEARAKSDMCSYRQSDWCNHSGDLYSYITSL